MATTHRMRAWIRELRTFELRRLVIAALVVGACWGFLQLADEVGDGAVQTFDEWLIVELRRPDDPPTPRGPAWLVQAGRDLTSLGGTPILMLAIAGTAGYLTLRRKPVAIALVLASGLGAMMVNAALKASYDRERPSLVPHLMEVSTPSFPSGHAMASAAVYLSLGLLLAKIQRRRVEKAYIVGIAMLLTVLVGLTRVYLGVHYPTDVLAGWMAGIVWAVACGFVANLFERRGQLETEARDTDPVSDRSWSAGSP